MTKTIIEFRCTLAILPFTFEKICNTFSKKVIFKLPNHFYNKFTNLTDINIYLCETDFNNRLDYNLIIDRCTSNTTAFKILNVYFSNLSEMLYDSLLNFFKIF